MPTIDQVDLPALTAVGVRKTVAVNGLPAFFAEAFSAMDAAIRNAGAHATAPPFARYHSTPPGPVDVEAVMPCSARVASAGAVQALELRGGPAVQVLHVGPYDAMAPLYADLARYLETNGLEPCEPPREVYLTSPSEAPDPSQWQTLIVQPTRPALHASKAQAAEQRT